MNVLNQKFTKDEQHEVTCIYMGDTAYTVEIWKKPVPAAEDQDMVFVSSTTHTTLEEAMKVYDDIVEIKEESKEELVGDAHSPPAP